MTFSKKKVNIITMNINNFDKFDEELPSTMRGVNSSNKRMKKPKSPYANPKFRMSDDYRPRVKTTRRPHRIADERSVEDMGF